MPGVDLKHLTGLGVEPSEVAQPPSWTIFYVPLQRGEFASATREIVKFQALI